MTTTQVQPFESFESHDPTTDSSTKKLRKTKKLRMLASAAIHALPDEFGALKSSFHQARTDMENVRSMQGAEFADEGEVAPTHKVSRLDVVKYMAWRAGFSVYQVADDYAGLPVFLELRKEHGVIPAFMAVKLGSQALAFGLGMGERKAQQEKAKWLGLDTKDYEGPLMDDVLDASVNSAPWGVMRHASAEREPGDPVEIVTRRRVLAMSEAYGDVNTAFYAGATAIPGLNSWTGFGVALGSMFQVKGTIRGYQERKADALMENDEPASNDGEVY